MKLGFFILLNCYFLTALAQNPTKGNFLNEVSTSAQGIIKEVDKKGDTLLEFDFGKNGLDPSESSKVIKKFKGTPYYGDQWFKGTVELQGSQASAGLIGFNVVKEVINFSPDDQTQSIELKPPRFTLGELVFEQMNDQVQGAKKHYYNRIVDGEVSLLKQHTGSLSNYEDKKNFTFWAPSNREYAGEFAKFEKYYFVINDELIPIKSKKSLLKSLGLYRNKAKKIIDENKLNLKEVNDIRVLAQLLNQRL